MEDNQNLTQRAEVVDNQVEQTDATDYISAINEIKANSVPRDKYEQLEREKKELIQALKEGNQVSLVDDSEKKSVDELRSDLFKNGPDMTNLDYIKATLELRSAILENGGRDPFLPNGKQYIDNDADALKAEQVAQALEECIDYANGNSQLFTQELMRRTKDDGSMRARR